MWKRPEISTHSDRKTYAILDRSRTMGATDAGPVVSIHVGEKGFAQAHKAPKKMKHARIVELKGKRQWQVGDHINGLVDIEHEKNSRWL
jgi:hypothetical protein